MMMKHFGLIQFGLKWGEDFQMVNHVSGGEMTILPRQRQKMIMVMGTNQCRMGRAHSACLMKNQPRG